MSIQELRVRTGVGIVECSRALKDANDDVEKAIILLRERGVAKGCGFDHRTTKAGTVGVYVHHDGSLGTMVGLGSETDFVSRMPEFKELANNLAMQVAGKGALYATRKDVPAKLVEIESDLAKHEFVSKGMEEAKIARILPGKMDKFYEQIVLMDQPYLLDEKQKVSDVLREFSNKVKEKIEITTISKIQVGK